MARLVSVGMLDLALFIAGRVARALDNFVAVEFSHYEFVLEVDAAHSPKSSRLR